MIFFLLGIGDAFAAKTAPDFDLKDLNGKSISLKKYSGKVVLVDFWASWCGPCRKSFPWMNKVQKEYGKKGFEVVAINLDTERELVDEFLTKNKAQFKIALDPEGKTAERYGVIAMPSAYLVDGKGKIVQSYHGFLKKDVLKKEKHIQELLK